MTEGSASPNNVPAQIAPPKPTRVVADAVARDLSLTSSPMLMRKERAGSSLSARPLRSLYNSEEDGDDEEVAEFLRRRRLAEPPRGRAAHFDDLLEETKLLIFSYLFLNPDLFSSAWGVCKSWNRLCRSRALWNRVPSFNPNGSINPFAFRNLGTKNQGTEGTCFKVFHRRSGRLFAMKRARVYPQGEGVPYYMLRELAFLKGLKHPNIASVERISLFDNKLHLFFGYMDKSLFDLINPNNDANGGFPLPSSLTKRFLYQILQGVAFCHQRGVLHRNLKPKHLLIDIPALSESAMRCVNVDEEKTRLGEMLGMDVSGVSKLATDLTASPPRKKCKIGESTRAATASSSRDAAASTSSGEEATINTAVHRKLLESAEQGTVRISDFALVRSTSIPLRSYTAEVVTLWYRSPEVLMGGQYFAAVDIWSVGCVFAEMFLGKPLFPGICEIDQLFQIFFKLGTPDDETWEEFRELPNYKFEFPNWKQRPLKKHINLLEPAGLDLMAKLLHINPSRRITAEDALKHEYFDSVREGSSLASLEATEVRQAERLAQRESLESALPEANRSFDKDFPPEQYPPGRMDLNNLSWAGAGTMDEASCWKYSIELENIISTKERSRKGLEDPVYLVRYYLYLKSLEKEMYPLVNYMGEALTMNKIGKRPTGLVGSGLVTGVARLPGSGPPAAAALASHANVPDAAAGTADQAGQPSTLQADASIHAKLMPHHRSMLVDWLVEVIDVFEMSVRSVFMAVNYTDRYLAINMVERKRFQLLGATCLHIASKCEDVSYIGVDDLVVCADKVYKPEDVLALEEQVLNSLDFRICVPTVVDFLNVFVIRLQYSAEEDAICTVTPRNAAVSPKQEKAMQVSIETHTLARYLAELSLQELSFISRMPSLVAAACLVLAVFNQREHVEWSRVTAVTGYTASELCDCVNQLRVVHVEARFTSQVQVILRRYQRPDNFGVANFNNDRPLEELFGPGHIGPPMRRREGT